jgi:hypothetical protein
MSTTKPTPEVLASMTRRSFLSRAASGTAVAAMGGGLIYILNDRSRARPRP